MSRCDQPAGRFVPHIDLNKCEGKGPCVTACPYDVLAIKILDIPARQQLSLLGKVKSLVHGWRKAHVAQSEACLACNACVRACPEQAIRLVPRLHTQPSPD